MRIIFLFLVALAACSNTEHHMGLLDNPPTRPRTYVVGTDIDPNDMNELFDVEIARRGEHTKLIHPSAFNGTSGVYAYMIGGYFESSGGGTAVASIPMDAGDRIVEVIVEVYGNGVADITQIDLERHTGAGGLTIMGTAAVNNPPAAWNDTPVDAGDVELDTNDSFQIRINYNAAGIRIGNVRIVYDRPAAP